MSSRRRESIFAPSPHHEFGIRYRSQHCDLDTAFLDKRSSGSWHDGMLIDDTTLEVPFMADLVTLADPTSEYSDYLQWVANRLGTVRFEREVTAVEERDGAFLIKAVQPESGERFRYRADNVVLGVGSRPFVPEQFRDHRGERIFHTASYLHQREWLFGTNAITVIGSGQSAGEVVLDLPERQPDHGYRIDWLTRSEGFFPMEYSKLGLQHFTPEYTSYFYDLPKEQKDEILANQDLLYKGLDVQTSAASTRPSTSTQSESRTRPSP